MSNTWIIMKKNFKSIFSGKLSFLELILPVAIIFIFFKLFSMSDNSIRIGMVDMDNSGTSQEIVSLISKMNNVKIINLNENEIEDAVKWQKVNAVFKIPKEYEVNMVKDTNPKIEVLATQESDIYIMVKEYLNVCVKNISDLSKGANGNLSLYKTILNNFKKDRVSINLENLSDKGKGIEATLSSIGFFLAYIMMRCSTMVMNILKEKKNNTYARIFFTPIKYREYVLGNFIAYFLFMIIQIVIVLLGLKYLLKIDMGVSMGTMFLILMAFTIASIALGMMIVAIFKTEQGCASFSSVVIMGGSLLGGCFIPYYIMPEKVKIAANITPQRWALNAIEKIQEGASIGSIFVNLVVLLLFTLAFITIAIYFTGREKKSLDNLG